MHSVFRIPHSVPSTRNIPHVDSLLFLLLPFFTKAQTQLFTETTPGALSLTTAELMRYNALAADTTHTSEIRVVQLSNPTTLFASDTMLFTLPDRSDTLSAVAVYVQNGPDTNSFVLTGRFLNQPGYFSLTRRSGDHYVGFFQVDQDFYELVPAKNDWQYLLKRSPASNLAAGCGMPEVENTNPIEPEDCTISPEMSLYNTCPAVIIVLLAITPEAKDWIETNYADVDAFVATGQSIMNLAFVNSDIPNKEVRMKWVEFTPNNPPFSDPSSPNFGINDDRANLTTWLSSERASHKADIAILVTNRNYPQASGAALAIGPIIDKAYAIVEAPYFNSDYILAHEIGHLLGGRHNWLYNLGNDNTGVCYHAYRVFQVPPPIIYHPDYINPANTWHSLIAIRIPIGTEIYYIVSDTVGDYNIQILNNDPKILHYSNPDVYYLGLPTGRHDANNALLFRNTACTVADFFPTQDLAVFISMDAQCYNTPVTFTADIIQPESGLPGIPPYTINWDWSPNGLFLPSQTQQLGTGLSISLSEHPHCPAYFIRCAVTSSDGVTVNRILRVDLYQRPYSHCSCPLETGDPDEERTLAASDTEGTNAALRILPNPTSGTSRIRLLCPSAAGNMATASIVDITGMPTVTSHTLRFDAYGVAELTPPAQLPAGVYYLLLQTENGTLYNTKLLITKN